MQAMAHVTGNEEFQGRVEYTPLCKAVFPRWLYLTTMISFLVVLQVTQDTIVANITLGDTLFAASPRCKHVSMVISVAGKQCQFDRRGRPGVCVSVCVCVCVCVWYNVEP